MASYVPKFSNKYAPRDTIGTSKYGNTKYVAYLIERYARFSMPVTGRQSCRMSIWSPVRQDAEIFANRNGVNVYHYRPEVYGEEMWIASIGFKRAVQLLAVVYDELCPAHKRLTEHLVQVRSISEKLLTMHRGRFRMSGFPGMLARMGPHSKKAEKMRNARQASWHDAVMLAKEVDETCKSRNKILPFRQKMPVAIVPKPVALDLTVGEVLR